MRSWQTPFAPQPRRALIVLNQPFSAALLAALWANTDWHCCADGGANRLHDLDPVYVPDLIKGDLDSLRPDVAAHYRAAGVPIVQDDDQYSTDLQKCIQALEHKERTDPAPYSLVLLGALSGRLDHTVHLLALLHRLRASRPPIFAVTDDNIAWVLDAGQHAIPIDHARFGPTCGLLPLAVPSTTISTTGLRWDVTHWQSSFDTRISTSNHLDPAAHTVYITTSHPIWWCMELRPFTSVRVLYFAAASTAANRTTDQVPVPPAGLPLSDLPALLAARHPDTGLAAILAASQWAVDAEMVSDPAACILKGGEEVAVICPVSGG